MKKLLLILSAFCLVAFSSCMKEKDYVIRVGNLNNAESATLTVFEYSGDQVETYQEIKLPENGVNYDFVSHKASDKLVIGFEGIVNGHITEWYSRDAYELKEGKTTVVEVDWKKMPTLNYNPVNPQDIINRYLYKK